MSKDIESTRKEQYLQKRKELIELSKFVRMGVKSGAYDSVNEGLKEIYHETNPEIQEFKTFFQWKEEGATVRKGEKAFLIWGQPRKASQVPDGATEPEEFKYWPVCYLFANTQVYKPEPAAEQETQHKPEPELETVSGDEY
jgi:hypothetical protein